MKIRTMRSSVNLGGLGGPLQALEWRFWCWEPHSRLLLIEYDSPSERTRGIAWLTEAL